MKKHYFDIYKYSSHLTQNGSFRNCLLKGSLGNQTSSMASLWKNPVGNIIFNPCAVFGHFWPNNFTFWNCKNCSFIGMVRNLVTFMALGMWTHKIWGHDSKKLSARKKIVTLMVFGQKWPTIGNEWEMAKNLKYRTFLCTQSTNPPRCRNKLHSNEGVKL